MTHEPTINHYGQMAWDHWRKHRPQDLALIEDPTRFFRELGEQVAETVRNQTDRLLASQPPASGFTERLAQQQTARQTAEDETLRRMVFTEPGDTTSGLALSTGDNRLRPTENETTKGTTQP